MRFTRLLCAVVLVTHASGPAAAQDTVPNPEFTNWSKFKKGTSVTLKSTSEVMGMTSEVLIINILIEAGDEKLVIETSSVAKVNGMEFKTPAMKRDVPKSVALPKGVKKEEFHAGKPPGTTEEGTETIKVAGMDVKAKWYKYTAEVEKIKTEAKMWMSEDVPGMLVKSEMTTSGAFATKTKMEITEIKKP